MEYRPGITCERCGKLHEMRYNHVETAQGTQIWCGSCSVEHATECQECQRLIADGYEHECKGEN